MYFWLMWGWCSLNICFFINHKYAILHNEKKFLLKYLRHASKSVRFYLLLDFDAVWAQHKLFWTLWSEQIQSKQMEIAQYYC